MQDITERLEAELSSAPAPTFDLASTMASGRRAVRRRRLVSGGAALALAAVVGGGGLALVGGAARADDGSREVADGGSGLEGIVVTEPGDMGPVTWEPFSTTLRVDERFAVTAMVDDPAVGTAVAGGPDVEIARSVALVLERGGQETWIFAWRGVQPEGSGGSGSTVVAASPADTGFDRFDDWVDLQADVLTTLATDQLVAYDGDQLTPVHPGVRILAQAPITGEDAIADGAQVAAQVAMGETTYWVVAEVADGAPRVVVEEGFVDAVPRPTFARFVAYVQGSEAGR